MRNIKEVPNPAKPLICIYAAPTSLCIAGYVQSVTPKSYAFLIGMLVVATVIYLFALVKAVTYLKMPFMQYIVLIETVLAVVFVAYTFIRYMGFLFAGKK